MSFLNRRDFIHHLGLSSLAMPFVTGLPSFGAENSSANRQRLVIIFSPDGTIPKNFWPDEEGAEFNLKPIMKPFAEFKDQLLVLHGVCDKIKGDGDSHMRGIGCLLTGSELYPGNIQGGSHTPAGWASGLSIDQEIKQHLQQQTETQTRFGSLEFGVVVPERADTWTRMVYAGPNKPISPIDDPYQMLSKLYGRMKDRESLKSILDPLQNDLAKIRSVISAEDRNLLEEHSQFVRDLEHQLQQENPADAGHAVPQLEPGIRDSNDNMPKITEMQIKLMMNSFKADFTRIATLQFTNSVGQAKMRWLGIEEGQHGLSHEPDSNEDAVDKLTRINTWYAEQIASLARQLKATPEPGGSGNMLDHTTIVWTNELGKGNSHTLDNIPFVLLGGGLGYQMGRSLKLNKVPHNRLLMSLAHSFGHEVKTFGNPDYCGDGALALS